MNNKQKINWRAIATIFVVSFLASCVGIQRYYEPAGFKSISEVRPYVAIYEYLASRLTSEEWHTFYTRFPEHWQDMQRAKRIGSSLEYHPWYTAYAFRWTTLRKFEVWDNQVQQRLQNRTVVISDDIFKIIYALGPPSRIIWNNDFEILLYRDGRAINMKGGSLYSYHSCEGCWMEADVASGQGLDEREILENLGFSSNR